MGDVLLRETGRQNREGPEDLEPDVRHWGERIFALMDEVGRPSLFRRKGFDAALMDWAMRDPAFKTQLFRFVDVLPSLRSPGEIAERLEEYLGGHRLAASALLRFGLQASAKAPRLAGLAIKHQVTSMARRFMLQDSPRAVISALRDLRRQGIGFTVDLLGETVVSEEEADQYARRCLGLLDLLAAEFTGTPGDPGLIKPGAIVNLSIKISALASHVQPANPDEALVRISGRLRPILRRAAELNAFINFDMEQFERKDLTLLLFKTVFSETEFAREPGCGLALQAYLRETEADLNSLLAWARQRDRRLTVRLVKGAYWDYETVIAGQRGWPNPVFQNKAETDADFERLTRVLLENADTVEAAFGTHNVRSIAYALAQAERLGLDRDRFEFQMLHGMADSTKSALVELGCRVREYCPVGELLPGMAYLVRRLLENTSNEGFLARNQSKEFSRDQLLARPELELPVRFKSRAARDGARSPWVPASAPTIVTAGSSVAFENEPPTDFGRVLEREKLLAALAALRPTLGRRHGLVIDNRSVETRDWLPSLNPASQTEVIGYAAQAAVSDAEDALAVARRAQIGWARTSADARAERVERLAQLLRRDRASLSALEILEAGKSWQEADADVAEAIDFCRFYARISCDLGRFQRTQPTPGESNAQHWWPRGVGLVVAPWNFPLAILTGMTVAAVATGNTVVMKPSDQTPILGAWLMERMMEAGFPSGVVNLLTGPGSTVGAHLVAHPAVDFVAFTGSKEVGLAIWEQAGRTRPGQAGLKKVICEMGGKNAMIIDDDADLDEAVTGVVASAFGYQGQKCSALSRLILSDAIYDRLLSRLIAATRSLIVGPGEQPGTTIGPVISREAQRRILAIIEAGRREATLAWQGQVPDDSNACYVPPTIFTEVPAHSRLFREEIFGPVLSVTRASDFDDALRLANTSEFALTGGLYSRSPSHIERAREAFVCGNLYINRPITGALVGRQPFGGFKMSGGGTKAGGREYLQQFMVPRVVTENCLRRGFAPENEL